MSTFVNRFKCNEDCYKYLSEIKWPDGRFVCAKCGNTTFHVGRSPYSRRCNRCKYDESVTSGTMFNKLRFPILTAFNIIYRLETKGTGNSSVALAEALDIQQKTCLAFKHKVQQAMGALQQKRLAGIVALDMFSLYNIQPRRYWESLIEKHHIAVAIEVRGEKPGRAFAEVIEEKEQPALIPFIERHVQPDAEMFIQEQYGYKTMMKKRFKNINFMPPIPVLEDHINNIADWIYNECGRFSPDNLQGYLDEFNFRFNHPNYNWRNFDSLIRVMANNNPARVH